MSALALLALFAAVFAALGLAGAGAVGVVAPGERGLAARAGAEQPALRASIVLAPAILALLGCVALASPAPFEAACHCAAHGLHHPHLCLQHPAFAEPLAAPAALIVAAWLALAAPRLLRVGREALAASRWARAVRRLPATRIDGVTMRVADCGAPGAFTVGALSPVILVDRGLFASLSEEARRVVAHHEQGHATRRDALTLLALQIAAALFPIPGARRLIEAWRDAAEGACDRYAAAQLGDPAAVAEALVAVERARAEDGRRGTPPLTIGFGAPAGASLERRVRALLDGDGGQESAAAPPLRNDALAAGLATLAGAALAALWPGDRVHHAVETLLGWLVH